MPASGSHSVQSRLGSVWKAWSGFWAKHGGVWKKPLAVHVKSGGNWVKVWTERPLIGITGNTRTLYDGGMYGGQFTVYATTFSLISNGFNSSITCDFNPNVYTVSQGVDISTVSAGQIVNITATLTADGLLSDNPAHYPIIRATNASGYSLKQYYNNVDYGSGT